MRRFMVIAALVGVGFPTARAHAQDTGAQDSVPPMRWAWKVPDGRWITIRNVNGPVRVHHVDGDSVIVTATKHVRRGDAAYVHYDVQRYGNGNQDVLVCALWGSNAHCTPTDYDYHRDDHDRRRNQISVEFGVGVPAGVKVGAHTVNSGVTVTGVTSEVQAGTVNGSVDVETDGGPVSAATVNGSVHASMPHYTPTQDMSFTSVNGSVVVELGNDVNANVELQTVNGRFTTDFPVTLNGHIDSRHLTATLGKGGPRITMTTVNGNVELRKH